MSRKKRASSFDGKEFFIMFSVLLVLLVVFVRVHNSAVPMPPTVHLNDLQATACIIASERGTCDSRLPEVGIVLKEECCSALGRCCG